MLYLPTRLEFLLIVVAFFPLLTLGCAEGPLWRTGKYAPWVQNKWDEEAKLADTLFRRKKEMSSMVSAAINAPINEQEKAAQALAEIYKRDRVLLSRLHAVRLLGKLSCPTAMETLAMAANDHNRDVRLESIRAWQQQPADKAIPQLQRLIGSDTDIDVRLAATRALSDFSGPQAVRAISLALQDSDPALQLRAVEALQQVTGESIGPDVDAWRTYVAQLYPPASSSGSSIAGSNSTEDQFEGASVGFDQPLDRQ